MAECCKGNLWKTCGGVSARVWRVFFEMLVEDFGGVSRSVYVVSVGCVWGCGVYESDCRVSIGYLWGRM